MDTPQLKGEESWILTCKYSTCSPNPLAAGKAGGASHAPSKIVSRAVGPQSAELRPCKHPSTGRPGFSTNDRRRAARNIWVLETGGGLRLQVGGGRLMTSPATNPRIPPAAAPSSPSSAVPSAAPRSVVVASVSASFAAVH